MFCLLSVTSAADVIVQSRSSCIPFTAIEPEDGMQVGADGIKSNTG